MKFHILADSAATNSTKATATCMLFGSQEIHDYAEDMLLSVRELITWTGLGPFELSVHCFALSLFSILTILKLDDVITSTWHSVFIPLYVATTINLYYDVILFIRLTNLVLNSHSRKLKRFAILFVLSNLFVLGLLLFMEHSTAEYLDIGTEYRVALVLSVSLFMGYFLIRIFFVYRSV